MIRCIAVDDETPALEILEDNISQIPFLQLVTKCKNAYAAMEVLQKEPVDLLFLDIEMPGIDGLTFLKNLHPKPMVIFITAYKQYAAEGFDLDVLDYLIKPVSIERFKKAVNKAQEYQVFKKWEAHRQDAALPSIPSGKQINSESSSINQNSENNFPDYFFVQTEYKLVKIFLHEILYIEGLRNYIKIFITGNTRPIISKLSLKAISDKLPPYLHARVHKSFIVILDKIGRISNDNIQIGETEIPISRSCREEFFKKVAQKNVKSE